jgi:acetylglutamate/LysW-gamma-L-alpha-aminoadipate kinase
MIVVKAGGRVIDKGFNSLVKSVAKYSGKAIMVHGGGDQVTAYCKRLGIEPVFVTSPQGIRSRYTTKEELEVYVMVMNFINKRLVLGLSSLGKKALGISGVDSSTIIAERKKRIVILDERGKKRIIEGGYTGKVTAVAADTLSALSSLVDVLVVSPIALDPSEGILLNVDGDQTAFAVSSALRVEILILLTDVPGVLIENEVVGRLSVSEAKELAQKIGPGMNRKLLMAAEAVEKGVGKVIISSGLTEDPIGDALAERGTVVK